MCRGIILFLSGFFIFQFANLEMPTGLFVKGGYCAQTPTGSLGQAGGYAEKGKIDLNHWDFGKVKPEAVLKHDFILKNQTKDILKINNIHSSCGCTVSTSDKQSLLPQESTVIKVIFNSHGYSGPVTQFVYVNTDNPDLAIIKFTVKAEVVSD